MQEVRPPRDGVGFVSWTIWPARNVLDGGLLWRCGGIGTVRVAKEAMDLEQKHIIKPNSSALGNGYVRYHFMFKSKYHSGTISISTSFTCHGAESAHRYLLFFVAFFFASNF
jgi:hypothetical protein